MKAVILARVSTTRQEEEGHSLPAQIRRLQEYAKKKGFELVKEFCFSESAGPKIRTKFEEVMTYLKENKDVKVLLCENVDRATRNFKDAVDLDEMRKNEGLEIHFVQDGFFINKNASGNQMFMWEAKVFIAKQYLNRLSDDVKRSNEQKLQNKQWIGKAPIGYINVLAPNGDKDIMPDPLRSHLVVKIFEMYATGSYSTQKIKEEMDKLGLKSNMADPKPLSKSQIFHTLNNPFYYGVMRVNGQLYPHRYQPIISQILFNRVRDVFKGYKKQPYRYGCKPFVFRALLKCVECGCLISGEEKKGLYIYYSCSNYNKVHKQRIYVKEKDLFLPIQKVFKKIENKLSDQRIKDLIEDLKKTEKSKTVFSTVSLESLRKDYDLYAERRSNAFDKYMDGELAKDIYEKKMLEYDTKQANITTEMKNYQEADAEFYITISLLLGLAQRAYNLFESSEPHEKRAIVNFLLQNCKLDGKNLKFELKTPFNRVLQANSSYSGLAWRDDFRNYDWEKAFPSPESTIAQIKQLLTLI